MDNAGERDNYKHHLVNGFAVKLAEGVSDGSLTSVNHEFTKLPGLKRGVQVHVVHSILVLKKTQKILFEAQPPFIMDASSRICMHSLSRCLRCHLYLQ